MQPDPAVPKLKIWKVPRWLVLLPLSKSEGLGVLVLLALVLILVASGIMIFR